MSLKIFVKKVRANLTVTALAVFFGVGLAGPLVALAAGPAQIDLLSAGSFVLLSKTGITDTASHASIIGGNIGSSPITAAAMNTVWCSEVAGTIYGVDSAYVGSGNQACFGGYQPLTSKALVDEAVRDMEIAYYNAAVRTNPTMTELGAGNIGGLTLAPGLYRWSADVTIPTDVTLSGSANDVWIFQIAGNLSITSGTKVVLTGGAKFSNVFWQVGGNSGATLGTFSTFNGTILSAKQIVIQTGATLNGRALSQTQVTLDAVIVTALVGVDATRPTAPANLARLATGATNTATILWSASSDNVSVVGYQVSVDGQPYKNVGQTLSFATSVLNQGNHTTSVRAVDAAGNVSVATPLSFTISLSSPLPPNLSLHPLTLENMLLEAALMSDERIERAEFEAATSTTCELPSATAAARVNVILGNSVATNAVRQAIENFMACGTPASLHLGSGERLGAVNSYYAAFGRWPSTSSDWFDVLKIANGRFPGETSTSAIDRSKASFHRVYRREADMNVSGDNNAMVVMAYGLRPWPRNMTSELTATTTFRSVYARPPTSGSDWDIVRAVAYSGASR